MDEIREAVDLLNCGWINALLRSRTTLSEWYRRSIDEIWHSFNCQAWTSEIYPTGLWNVSQNWIFWARLNWGKYASISCRLWWKGAPMLHLRKNSMNRCVRSRLCFWKQQRLVPRENSSSKLFLVFSVRTFSSVADTLSSSVAQICALWTWNGIWGFGDNNNLVLRAFWNSYWTHWCHK